MKIYFYIILFFSISSQAQNLDSLYNILMSSRSSVKYDLAPASIEEKQPDKCGFGLAATIKEHFNEFSIEKQQNITKVMARPELHTSIVSPSGLFRIHYDTTGFNKPQYGKLELAVGIYEVAVAFDSAYNFEVNILGYQAAPIDNDFGGDNKYDIYILNLNGGLYGATTPETSLGEGKYSSYIEIENSFNENEGYNTIGIDAARVTAAHEFHHAIQIGNYLYRYDDLYYYELTSTAFEEFVYDDVNDYYAYMNSFFRNTTYRLEEYSGYSIAIWNIFLQEIFEKESPMLGHEIVKKSWELMRDNDYRAIIAIANAMVAGHTFAQKFKEFGEWLFFTNEKTKEGEFFKEAINYPSIRSTYTIELGVTEKSLTIESEPTSINYLTFLDYNQGFADTIVAVLSNSNVHASTSEGNAIDVEVTMSNSYFNGGNLINENYSYYSKISGESVEFIQESYIINNILASETEARTEISFSYPQPFNYELYEKLNIPTYPDLTERAELNIYSPDMNLVYSGSEQIFSTEKIVVQWNGKDNSGKKLASGVYIYVTKANNKIKKGKLVILN